MSKPRSLSAIKQERRPSTLTKLNAIFIDDGFGHLDDQTLDQALDTLRDLIGNARALGVISHVDGVKQQIPAGFEVTPQLRGSRVSPRVA